MLDIATPANADQPVLTEPFVMLMPKPLSDAAIGALGEKNPLLTFEQSADGYLIVSPPTASFGNFGELELVSQISNWNKRSGFGRVGGLTGGPELPQGGRYAPDAYVVSNAKIAKIPSSQRKLWFAPALPTAVFELLSPSNRTRKGQARLNLLLADCERSRVPLVVLLDKKAGKSTIKRPGRPDEITKAPVITFEELPGLELDVAAIFAASE